MDGLATSPTISNVPSPYDVNESGISTMHYFLSRVTECRKTLGKLDRKLLVSDHDGDEQYMTIDINNREYPWLRILDPWGTPLRYDYYHDDTGLNYAQREQTIRSFPLVISAGPDKDFDTTDDITNRIGTVTPTQN